MKSQRGFYHWRSFNSYFFAVMMLATLQRSLARSDGRRILVSSFLVGGNLVQRRPQRCGCFSTLGDHDDDTTRDETIPSSIAYQTRSTSDPDMAAKFYEGSENRKTRLHKELQAIGYDVEELLQLPEFRGSAAARSYNSFVLPKSEGALAMAEQPQRAAVIANSISFLVREHRSHQEEWLRNHDRSLQEAEDQMKGPRHPITLVLDDIRSAHNVGNIIRFAEAARCQKVLLCGSMTPSPPHPKVMKTALGSAEYVPYETIGSALQAVRQLKAENVRVYAVETTSRSIPLWKIPFFEKALDSEGEGVGNDETTIQKIAFVFGNELVGVGVNVLEECDGIVSVPTHGIKNSLNVATCASVVTWEALRQFEMIQDGEGRKAQ